MVRAAALAVLLLLSACERSGDKAPFTDTRTPPGLPGRFLAPEGWAWGLVQIGEAPAQRYGVAAPPGLAPSGDVLILTGYGESAEAWFETVRDLTRQRRIVWVLERAGQGGSGRYVLPRDLGHVPDLEADVAAVKAMRDVVIRPEPGRALTVLAHDDAAVVALLAVERGLAVDGLVLSAPRWRDGAAPAQVSRLAKALGLGARPPPGWRAWRREDAGPDNPRARIQNAWQLANPDLRMAGPSAGWRAAFHAAREQAEEGAGQVAAPVLVVGDRSGTEDLCRALPRCRHEPLGGAGEAPHLERDALRNRWLEVLGGFLDRRDAAKDPA